MEKKHWAGVIVAMAAIFGIIGVVVAFGVTLYLLNADYEKYLDSEDGKNSEPVSHNDLIISESEPAEFNNVNGDSTGPAAKIENGEIIYTNAGSGSCPPVIDVAVYDEDSNTYSLSIKNYDKQMCTMDLRPLKQTIKHADGSEVPENAVIEIV